jgi:hypothetical protein
VASAPSDLVETLAKQLRARYLTLPLYLPLPLTLSLKPQAHLGRLMSHNDESGAIVLSYELFGRFVSSAGGIDGSRNYGFGVER